MAEINVRMLGTLIIRLVLAGVFTAAALPKIQDPIAFASSVAAFRVVSTDTAAWVALLLPWLELMTAIGLLTPWIRRSSGLCISLMLIVFIVLHASAWARGLNIDCGCFGLEAEGTQPNYLLYIVRNSGLLLASMLLVFIDLRNKRKLKHSYI